MMHTVDCSAFPPDLNSRVRVGCWWRVRERDRRTGLVVAQVCTKNTWTSYGLTAKASDTMPSTLYLAVENPGITVSSTVSSGVSSITLSAQAHQPGDTQLVVSVGLSNQETLTFSSATANGDGTYTYTLSSTTTQPHTAGDIACRQVLQGDTVASLVGEQEYDSTNFPGQRMNLAGGYSPGTGQWVYQFFYAGPTLQTTLVSVGMCDSPTIGAGNLLNHFVLGLVHSNPNNDLEIDGSLTLSNV